MSRVLDFSILDRFFDVYSLVSDLNCLLSEFQFDVNNNDFSSKIVSGFRTEVFKVEKLVYCFFLVDIVFDIEYY